MNWKVSLYDLTLDQQEIDRVANVIKSGWITMGSETAALEREISDRLELEHPGVAMSNCTAALHTAMHVLGIGPGDEVLVPSMTFVASIACVKMVGATPVFVDSTSWTDFSIDPIDLERKITDKTKAILVVHYGGYSADMKAIMQVARQHGLKVVEDVAHGPFVRTELGLLGTLGDVGCLSFFSTKNLSTGEGGMFVSRHPDLLEKARLFRSHYMGVSSWSKHEGRASSYDITGVGYNYRITDMTAAIGRVQLGKYDAGQQVREQRVSRYRERLTAHAELVVPYAQVPVERSSHHVFCVLLPEGLDRDRVIVQLKEAGIQTSVHYPAAHLFSYYQETSGTRPGDLPVAETIAARQLSLPLHPNLTEEQVDQVCDCLIEILEKVGSADAVRF